MRVAVVTGGSRGIGAAIADGLSRDGTRVAVWDVDPEPIGVGGIALTVDVSDGDSVDAAVAQTEEELGPIDILVNNAGIDVIGDFLGGDDAVWDRIIAVNLKGTILCCHRVGPGMVARKAGRIINIGSDAGKVGSSGEAVYSATKGGVIAFTKALARELAGSGVTVNCVCPGPTDTALLNQVAVARPKLYEGLARAIPMKRVAQPADIAPAVVFLAGDGAGYITGQALSVSGGLTMS
jgi:2-hydroxycyclohexanecarboxyl-CoA dehydrogenase